MNSLLICANKPSENKVPFVLAVQTVGANDKPHQVRLQQLPPRKAAVAEFCACHLVAP